MDLITVLDSFACLTASLLLWCMLQGPFKCSGRAFRWSVLVLSSSLAVSGVAPWLWGDAVEFNTFMVDASLLLMVGLIRLKQTEPDWYARIDAIAGRLALRLRTWWEEVT